MSFNRTTLTVSAASLDKDCNIKECLNCSDEFIKYAVQKCREMKHG